MRREYNIKKLNPRNNPYFKKLKNKKNEKLTTAKTSKFHKTLEILPFLVRVSTSIRLIQNKNCDIIIKCNYIHL